MRLKLPSNVLSEIAAVVTAAQEKRVPVQVYAEADRIRVENIAANIALEDIADEMISQASRANGYEADPSQARHAFMATLDQKKAVETIP